MAKAARAVHRRRKGKGAAPLSTKRKLRRSSKLSSRRSSKATKAPVARRPPATPKSPWVVDIVCERKTPPIDRSVLRRLIQSALYSLEHPAPRGIRTRGMLPFPPKSVRIISLSFVGDPKIHELNRSYRKKDKPTDVLSFPTVTPKDYGELAIDEVQYSLGDIVVSLDTAAVQSRRYGWSLGEELIRLLLHGVLHLLGYDHERVDRKDAELMRRIERRLFAKHRELSSSLISKRK